MATLTTHDLPAELNKLDLARLKAYRDNLAFYEGSQWPARRAADRTRRLTFNYARTFIDKVTSYTMKGLTIGVEPVDDSDDAAHDAQDTEQLLAEISALNNLPRLDYDQETDTSVLGDGAYKLLWNEPERRVSITTPDMQNLFVWPHYSDLTKQVRVAHRYHVGDNELIEDWTPTTVQLWTDNAPGDLLPNPYGFIPFIVYPNQPVPKRWYGLSDIEALRETAQELNSATTRLSRILEVSGNPIAVLEGIDDSEDIAVGPGAVWTIPENARAYLLDLLQGGGVTLHLDYIQVLLRALHDLTETPRTAFGDNQRSLSGIALQIELEPLLQKVSRKRLIRGQAFTARAANALRIHDYHTGSEHAAHTRFTVAWEDPTPADRSRDVADELALVHGGLSAPTTSMARLGEQDPDAERALWMKQKSEEARKVWLQQPPDKRIPMKQP